MASSVVVDHSQREMEIKAFHESKAGVKGLVDAGVTKLPSMFIHPPENLLSYSLPEALPEEEDDHLHKIRGLQFPVIDLTGFDSPESRKWVVEEIRSAAESWGFFQLVNHGIPLHVMEGIQRGVNFFSFHGDLSAATPADWRDTLSCKALQDPESFEAIPQICREEVREYMEGIDGVVMKLSELFSEALGLASDYLAGTKCFNARSMACHYFPICPEPHLTMDSVGGLQILHQGVWIDVPPVKGALLANIADMMQIITNGKFKSVEHRVLLRPTAEPRISIACFLSTDDLDRRHQDNKPIYDQVIFREYMKKYKL
ncbi:hypothetical protein VPH35_119680 [Triticum aestivum]